MKEESIPSTSQRLFMHNRDEDMVNVKSEERFDINGQYIDLDEIEDELADELADEADEELSETSANSVVEVERAAIIKRIVKRLTPGQKEFLCNIEQYRILWDPNERATEAQKKEFWQQVTIENNYQRNDSAQRRLKLITEKIGFEINDKIFECIRNENINPVQLAKPAPSASRVKSVSRAGPASRASGLTSFRATPDSQTPPASTRTTSDPRVNSIPRTTTASTAASSTSPVRPTIPTMEATSDIRARPVTTTSQQTPQQSSITTGRVLDELFDTEFKRFMDATKHMRDDVRFKIFYAMRDQFNNFIREHNHQDMDLS